jgi:hypothetical protein
MANEEIDDDVVQSDLFDVPDDEVDSRLIELANKVIGGDQDGLQDQEEQETQDEVEESDEDSSESSSEALGDDVEPEEGDSSPTASAQARTGYKEAYEAIFAPFKANGKEMRVDSIEDVRTLMQMGANYNKKMAALKPNLKVVKLLEKNNLLDEGKLNFLIDLQNKKPDAISKLIKDTGVDPLDINLDNAESYVPTNYTVSDKEVELDGILAEIRDTESFNTTADIISNKWDGESKKILYENPQLIRFINSHVSNGIFDKVSSIVERERILGRLTGISDIEAYKRVGDALNAQGYFKPQSTVQAPKAKVTNNNEPAIKDRKKAAGSTKSVTAPKQTGDFNPLSMSDEEFEKMVNSKFI